VTAKVAEGVSEPFSELRLGTAQTICCWGSIILDAIIPIILIT
jgi:hypothetical protein